MKQSNTPRLVAAIFLGMLFGGYRHFQQMKWLGRGRDAFLADRSHDFDQITKTHSAMVALVAGVILAVVAVAVYEGIVRGLAMLIPPVDVEE